MLISEEYRNLNKRLHELKKSYGIGGKRFVQHVIKICDHLGSRDVLDYGCGKGTLAANLPFQIKQYDPALPELSKLPEPADLVVCTDVLEHIEPEFIQNVLDDLVRTTKNTGLFTVATKPAVKKLEDGRNAHLIINTLGWWVAQLERRFHISCIQNVGDVFFIIIVIAKNEFNARRDRGSP